MKLFIFIFLLFSGGFYLEAQTSINNILQEIESNNKAIQAGKQITISQKLESSRGSNLPDPSVSYTHQYGNKEGLGIQGELVASQSFDFPSVYVQKNKLNKAKGQSFDLQQQSLRQQILLQAKEICIELIGLNKQEKLLQTRKGNAEKLSKLYALRLESGDANVLETNKIDLELINVRNEVRMNRSMREAKLQELSALNGGNPIDFSDTDFPVERIASEDIDSLKHAMLELNPEIKLLKSEKSADKYQLNVAKNMNLPVLELGYRLNTAKGGERFNGFIVGMSVPLFANRNHVKQIKAQSLYRELQTESVITNAESQLNQLYTQASALQTSIDEYSEILKNQKTLELLNKAIEAGQISMIEYFVDATSYYQTLQNYIQLQSEYQKIVAQIYKYKL